LLLSTVLVIIMCVYSIRRYLILEFIFGHSQYGNDLGMHFGYGILVLTV